MVFETGGGYMVFGSIVGSDYTIHTLYCGVSASGDACFFRPSWALILVTYAHPVIFGVAAETTVRQVRSYQLSTIDSSTGGHIVQNPRRAPNAMYPLLLLTLYLVLITVVSRGICSAQAAVLHYMGSTPVTGYSAVRTRRGENVGSLVSGTCSPSPTAPAGWALLGVTDAVSVSFFVTTLLRFSRGNPEGVNGCWHCAVAVDCVCLHVRA